MEEKVQLASKFFLNLLLNKYEGKQYDDMIIIDRENFLGDYLYNEVLFIEPEWDCLKYPKAMFSSIKLWNKTHPNNKKEIWCHEYQNI